jgi:uncharacterized membrane protein
MGSVGAAAWISHIVFLVLIVGGYMTEALSMRASIAFALLWIVPRFALGFMPSAAPFFSPYVAVLDIVLVLILFRGDVRLT